MSGDGVDPAGPVGQPLSHTESETSVPPRATGNDSAMKRIRAFLFAKTVNLRASRIAVFGFSVVAFWILVAIFSPLLVRYDPLAVIGQLNEGPGAEAWLGTDDRGRDIYSRIIAGSRTVLIVAPLSIALGAFVGVLIGLAAGYYRGWIDEVIQRTLDGIIAFPSILLFLIIVASIGASHVTLMVAIALGAMPGVARLSRAMALDLRTREYVAAARLRGESSLYIMFREILPNARGPIIIDLAIRVGFAIFAIATLGFLGIGLPPPAPEWGTMVAAGRSFIAFSPWQSLFPALAIASLVVSLNLAVDGIRKESVRYR